MKMILEFTQDDREQQMQIYLSLGSEEILSQCSEECCGLEQAAQKMRRVLHGTTHMSEQDARQALNEEACDVLLLLEYLDYFGFIDVEAAIESAREKNKRWYGRVIG